MKFALRNIESVNKCRTMGGRGQKKPQKFGYHLSQIANVLSSFFVVY